jgi:hypothetical protein
MFAIHLTYNYNHMLIIKQVICITEKEMSTNHREYEQALQPYSLVQRYESCPKGWHGQRGKQMNSQTSNGEKTYESDCSAG